MGLVKTQPRWKLVESHLYIKVLNLDWSQLKNELIIKANFGQNQPRLKFN